MNKINSLIAVIIFSFLISACDLTNNAPVANAGADQEHTQLTTIYLNGTGSTDLDNDSLSYKWVLTSIPSDSQVTLLDSTSSRPEFIADSYGEYVIELVVSDGELSSTADHVTVTITNLSPLADAGVDQQHSRPKTIFLNGAGSTDPNNDSLSYEWMVSSKPTGSQVAFADSSSSEPEFLTDMYGEYVIELIVNDGELTSAVDSVTILIINNAPVADAGDDQVVYLNSVVSLNGSNSFDPDDDPLSFQWNLKSRPQNSQTVLSSTSVKSPTFTVDEIGEYVISLTVNDGVAISSVDEIRIVADKVMIYSNDFSSPALNDFIVGEIGSGKVAIDQGQLHLEPGEGYLNRAFAALNLANLSGHYQSRLNDFPGKIIWAFNVSNVNGLVCGACNNLFMFNVYSSSDPSAPTGYGYNFSGGGFVGDRMMMRQLASANSPFGPVSEIMIDITNGLGNLPSIGAFKIIFDPSTSEWSLYYEVSNTVIDPLTITTLVGTSIQSGFTSELLPYLILGGQETASTYFDNLSVILQY